ncbi:unnamed protein product [Discula destructiva]
MAGCTDQSYVDKTCPQKLGFKDQEWVGMVHCGTGANGDTDWGGCKVDPANATDLFKLPNESCDDYCSTTLWVGAADIPLYAVLPTSTGGSISWASDFNPTATSRAPGTPGTATPTATQVTEASSQSLSTGAKAGIGAGCGVAALFVLGLFLWCCMKRRQRRGNGQLNAQQRQAHAFSQEPYPPTYHSGSIATARSPMILPVTPSPTGWEQQQLQYSNLSKPPLWAPNIVGHDAFSGFKNELPADEIRPTKMASPLLGGVTVPSSPVGREIERADSDASGTIRPREHRHDVAGGYYISPQSTGSEGYRLNEGKYGHRGPPSEMQG